MPTQRWIVTIQCSVSRHNRLTGVIGRRAIDGAGVADPVWSRKALFMGSPPVQGFGQKALFSDSMKSRGYRRSIAYIVVASAAA